jgi:hypothetical protein
MPRRLYGEWIDFRRLSLTALSDEFTGSSAVCASIDDDEADR